MGGCCFGCFGKRSKGSRKSPPVSAPLQLLLKDDGNPPDHVFLKKRLKKRKQCMRCHKDIVKQGSICRDCGFLCHQTCQADGCSTPVANNVGASGTLPLEARPARGWEEDPVRTGRPEAGKKPAAEHASPQPFWLHRADEVEKRSPAKEHTTQQALWQHGEENYVSMELQYITERIIALWFPVKKCQEGGDTKRSINDTREKLMSEAANMLRIKHGDTCMIFDLSIPHEDDLDSSSGSFGVISQSLGWPGTTLAPPLERLCSACKHIESWLSANPQNVAVLYSSDPCSEERIGVIIFAYLTYSSICGSEEQALDRFAMRRFFQDKIGGLKSPSNNRYVGYFSGLLSGDIRMNAEPLFLTHIVVHGAPIFSGLRNGDSKSSNDSGIPSVPSDVCGSERDPVLLSQCMEKQSSNLFFFLKIYQQGLTLVYTSPVYKLNRSTNLLTISLENQNQGYSQASSVPLHLRGDVLIKGYYLCQQCSPGGKCQCNGSRNSPSSPLHRHVIFQCQFHTCAVANHLLRYSKKELDEVESERVIATYPPEDGSLELYFAGSFKSWPTPASVPLIYPRNPSQYTPSIYAQPSLSSSGYSFPSMDDEEEQFAIGGVVEWDSLEVLSSHRRRRGDGGAEESPSSAESGRTPRPVREEEEVNHLTGPLDGSLYATISKSPTSPANAAAFEDSSRRARERAAPRQGANRRSRSMDPVFGGGETSAVEVAPPSYARSVGSPELSVAEEHARLDELLGDMLQTVQNIPDLDDAKVPSLKDGGPSSLPSPITEDGSDSRRREEELLLSLEEDHHRHHSIGSREERVRRGRGEGGGGPRAGEEDIPYHARQDSRPFTYGAVPERVAERRRLLAREEEDGGGGEEEGEEAGASDGCCAVDEDMRAKQQLPPGLQSPGLVRKVSSAGQRAAGGGRLDFDSLASDRKSPARETSSDWGREPLVVDLGSPSENYTGLTWLQRQQQKLRDRREGRQTKEKVRQDYRLLSELRTYQRSSSVSGARTLPSSGGRLSGREDGYVSDTSLFVGGGYHNGSGDDDWDEGRGKGDGGEVNWAPEFGNRGGRVPAGSYSLPLRINTADEEKVMTMSSEPGSPLLPRRSVSRETTSRYATSSRHVTSKHREDSTLKTIGSGVTGREWQMDGERPFVAVKRAHENRSKGSLGSLDDGVMGQISQSRDDSLSSWATASVTWGEEEDDIDGEDGVDGRRSRVRPQTPAFPVQPRTPYTNGSTTPLSTTENHHTLVEVNVQGSPRLPPKSPTAMRKERANMSASSDTQIHSGHHRSRSLSNGGPTVQNMSYTSATLPSGGQKPYYTEHHEVSPAHVKFVRDTSRFWYKPTISREEAISILKDKQPGTFVVRDSNSFPGAFGLALKVATPPANVTNRSNNASGDMSNELVRHFLIEPTSRGVKLKGCANEPVFSSLSALVYQHSLTPMALPCRLLLPESEPAQGKSLGPTDGAVTSNQLLLQQGAACNVLYLASVDTESLTGPQAVRRGVTDLFSRNPMPAPTVVHFKVSSQGITLTDNKRKLFFRRHYPVNAISHCGLDPDDHRWTDKNSEIQVSNRANRCFGFVARKPSTKGDNQCHIFSELDPEQPATAIVNFVTRVMMTGAMGKGSNIV
ncbi:tensin-2 isoform X2 [Ischnura elegans]|uniref:tensin-2 isoform X2 n=1 Tax=Ischnura elegans TaxID=197161 RepID=UPI001ED86791|nr:tensin-2 isoform X2 [Ischnura elegans]